MRSDFNRRQREGKKCRRIMLYVHGGAYFFGSVDEHRYQLQRHARKLQARVFAPRYRLAPQFPFPCGMLDCLAAYIFLLTIHDPTEIIFAGDSAGGGMILSMLCMLRDQQMPLPAGAILISPWVDLTHSFPSLSREDGLDYIPAHGFMQKPSRSWPPPNEDDIYEIVRAANEGGRRKLDANQDKSDPILDTSREEAAKIAARIQPPLSLRLDGKDILVKDQVQLYTTNQLITHPLVSPALQPSLGGLPPLLIMVGGGEILRDEQIYVAHKAAHPAQYKLNDIYRKHFDPDNTILEKYPPTPVQLQVWDDLCHVTPTLSFTRPAKFMYRSVAQFGAWALSRAQKRGIEIMADEDDDDDVDDTSSSSSDEDPTEKSRDLTNGKPTPNGLHSQIGRAGDALPPFRNHMIREQVDRHGNVYPLPRASELPALQMSSELVGVVKEGPIRHWLAAKKKWDDQYHSQRRRIQKQRVASYKAGNRLVYGDGEVPPPSALAGRPHGPEATKKQRLKKSWGLGLWSSWGWKQDEQTVKKQDEYMRQEEKQETSRSRAGSKARKGDSLSPTPASATKDTSDFQSLAMRRKTITVQDQGQVEAEEDQRSLTPERGRPTETEPPIISVDSEHADATTIGNNDNEAAPEQTVPPIFLPKWKNSPHLKSDSKDLSDAGSTYSRMTTTDNMSTRAVFSAPGVQRQDSSSNTLEASTPTSTTIAGEPPSFDFRPSTPGPQDNLGGYDTPVSKRSVERLMSHQVDGDVGEHNHDLASVHSSIPVGTAATVASPDVNGRAQPIRSPSSMAIVHAEGVISPTDEDGPVSTNSPAAEVEEERKKSSDDLQRHESDSGSGSEHPAKNTAVESVAGQGEDASTSASVDAGADVVVPENKSTAEANDKSDDGSETPKQRPALYNRDDSDFVTAMEKI